MFPIILSDENWRVRKYNLIITDVTRYDFIDMAVETFH